MNSEKIVIADEMVELIIADWEAFKPAKPLRAEPVKMLIFLPTRPFWVSVLLMQPFVIAMRLTGWRRYRHEYREWYNTITNRFDDIKSMTGTEKSISGDPQLMRLHNYLIEAGWRLDVGM